MEDFEGYDLKWKFNKTADEFGIFDTVFNPPKSGDTLVCTESLVG